MKNHIWSCLGSFLAYYLITSFLDHQWKRNIVIALVFAIFYELFQIGFTVLLKKQKGKK